MKDIPVRKINGSLTEQNLSKTFTIRDVKDLLAGKDMIQELHRHDFYYILALKKGKGDHDIDFSSYKICDHSIFFMRPGQVHQLILKTGSTGYLMEFKNDFYYLQNKTSNHLLRKASGVNHYKLEADRFEKLQSVLNYIFQEHINKQDRYQEIIKANLDIFFVELGRQNSVISSNDITTYTQERYEKLLELLETHIAKKKQVTQYADILNLSSYQLNALTKSAIGKTCSALINEHIILESKRYLLATPNQINQIAYHLGYEDVSYFIRFFKKHTGYSPEAFRNKFM